jgi:hypothetical protein
MVALDFFKYFFRKKIILNQKSFFKNSAASRVPDSLTQAILKPTRDRFNQAELVKADKLVKANEGPIQLSIMFAFTFAAKLLPTQQSKRP